MALPMRPRPRNPISMTQFIRSVRRDANNASDRSSSCAVSALDVSFGPIGAAGYLVVPMSVAVLPRDEGGLARLHLLLRGAERSLACLIVGAKALRVRSIGAVGPATIMRDDLIGHLAHGTVPDKSGFTRDGTQRASPCREGPPSAGQGRDARPPAAAV